MVVPHPLIHDWNPDGARPRGVAMLDDETLRDGLQSPSVRTPTIDEKIDILQRMDALGIDTANIGLPAAGPQVAADVERLARAIGELRLKIRPNCAARTVPADIRPIAEISQRAGIAIECCAFIGSSPIRRHTEGWTLEFLQKTTEDAIGFAVGEGLKVLYVTEDTTRADPGSLRALFTTALRSGASRLCIADTVRHATPAGASAVVLYVNDLLAELGSDAGIDWHGHSDRGFGVASALAALEAGATRLHGSALGIGERSGNTPMDLLMVNLVMMGYIDRDLRTLPAYCEAVSRASATADPGQLPRGRRRCVSYGDRGACGCRHEGIPQTGSRADGRRLRSGAGHSRRARAGDRGRTPLGPLERRLLARTPQSSCDRRNGRTHLHSGQSLEPHAHARPDAGADQRAGSRDWQPRN